MKKKGVTKLIAALLAVALVGTGCQGQDGNEGKNDKGGGANNVVEVDF